MTCRSVCLEVFWIGQSVIAAPPQESGETRVSQPCPAGSHQSLPGEAVCEACQPGTSSAEDHKSLSKIMLASGLMQCWFMHAPSLHKHGALSCDCCSE